MYASSPSHVDSQNQETFPRVAFTPQAQNHGQDESQPNKKQLKVVRRVLGRLRLAEIVRLDYAGLTDDCVEALCSGSGRVLKELHLSRATRVSVPNLMLALSRCPLLHTLRLSNIWVRSSD
jgi:hypothetical protein